jgi:hypothetical protein
VNEQKREVVEQWLKAQNGLPILLSTSTLTVSRITSPPTQKAPTPFLEAFFDYF